MGWTPQPPYDPLNSLELRSGYWSEGVAEQGFGSSV